MPQKKVIHLYLNKKKKANNPVLSIKCMKKVAKLAKKPTNPKF